LKAGELWFIYDSARELSVLHSVQAGSWAYSALCSLGAGALSQGVKWPGPETDDLHSGVKSE